MASVPNDHTPNLNAANAARNHPASVFSNGYSSPSISSFDDVFKSAVNVESTFAAPPRGGPSSATPPAAAASERTRDNAPGAADRQAHEDAGKSSALASEDREVEPDANQVEGASRGSDASEIAPELSEGAHAESNSKLEDDGEAEADVIASLLDSEVDAEDGDELEEAADEAFSRELHTPSPVAEDSVTESQENSPPQEAASQASEVNTGVEPHVDDSIHGSSLRPTGNDALPADADESTDSPHNQSDSETDGKETGEKNERGDSREEIAATNHKRGEQTQPSIDRAPPSPGAKESLDVPAWGTETEVSPSAGDNESRERPAAATPPPADGADSNGQSTNESAGQPEGAATSKLSERLIGKPHNGGEPGLKTVDRQRLIGRVARAFQSANQRGGALRIRLHPRELGALRIELRIENGNMSAKLEVESNYARAALLDNLNGLRERLSEQGVRIEQFDVELSGGGEHANGQLERDPTSEGRQADRPIEETNAPAEDEDSGSAVITPNEDGGLNVVV